MESLKAVIVNQFGDRLLTDIKTADVEDFIAYLRKPHIAGRRKTPRTLSPASINRTIELMRHMMNCALGREYLEDAVQRGTGALIEKLREDNQFVDEEARLLEVAPPLPQSMGSELLVRRSPV